MKFARFYALITQFVIEMLVLVFLGMFIGNKIDPDGILSGILGTIGGLLGITFFIIYIIREGSKDERAKGNDGSSGNGCESRGDSSKEDTEGRDSEA